MTNRAEPKSVALVSLGCDKNLTDSEVMLGLLNESGYSFADDPADADIIILNTCGFIKSAADESYEKARELVRFKRTGCCKVFIITGCLTERHKEAVRAELPEADAIVGVNGYQSIAEIIGGCLEGEKISCFAGGDSDIARFKRIPSTPEHYAYLKIAEGCDNFCTYCTIPSIRGRYKSRSMESLLAEAEILALNGVRELIIVAQDSTRYGEDLYNTPKLPELLRELAKITGIKWIRLLYCYPERITEELVREIAENEKLVKYIDMPIQHASGSVLERMNRPGDRASLTDTIRRLRASVPDIVLRTTLMTGFPGETEEEHRELVSFVKEVSFDKLGVFAYSPEEGTPAAGMNTQIPEKVKQKRVRELMLLQQKISTKKNKARIGRVFETVVEGTVPEDRNVCFGRTYMDCPDVDGLVFFSSKKRISPGDFVNVKITGAGEYDLTGEVV